MSILYICHSDEDEVAHLLVTANADVNSKNNKGATPLIIAAVKGHHSVLRILTNHPTVKLHEQVCTYVRMYVWLMICICFTFCVMKQYYHEAIHPS